MSLFESRVYAIEDVLPHPNADRLELAAIGGYRIVVVKDRYKPGDVVAYIPEAAIVPDDVIAELGLEGRLAGKKRNRVKPIKLRGALSEGLVYPPTGNRLKARSVAKGDVVTDLLGLVKYEPPIPIHMSGDPEAHPTATLKYDIESWKKFPDAFKEGERVIVTEKIHGTWCCLADHECVPGGFATSKGMSARGLVFPPEKPGNKDNLYARAFRQHRDSLTAFRRFAAERFDLAADRPVYLVGEVYGRGVQDLTYGELNPRFRVFDAHIDRPRAGRYLNRDELRDALRFMTDEVGLDPEAPVVPGVPLIYDGPYSADRVPEWTSGPSTLAKHTREGCVMHPAVERDSEEMYGDRLILKNVAEEYLLRSKGTSYQ